MSERDVNGLIQNTQRKRIAEIRGDEEHDSINSPDALESQGPGEVISALSIINVREEKG